jgi:hypothetical protein
MRMNSVTFENARQAKEQVRTILQGRTELSGIGIGIDPVHNSYLIKVNLSESLPDNFVNDFKHISEDFGISILVRIIGSIQALQIIP